MKITKSQKRLFLILAVVLMYAAYDIFSNSDQYLKYYGAAKQLTEVAEKAPLLNQTLIDSLQKRLVFNKWKKNPFLQKTQTKLFSTQKSNSQKTFKLSAIMYEAGNSFAIINGSIVQEGDNISGFLVKSIAMDNVTIAKKSKVQILAINGGE